MVIVFAVLLFLRRAEPVSFIFGLWIGATDPDLLSPLPCTS
jgi:hypothetical protein